jgi:preprotein translocase subunit YajC
MLNSIFNWAFGLTTAIAETAPAAGTELSAGDPTGSLVSMLLPMVLIFVVFYFMLIRPQRKKDKKVKDMLSNLKVTDRICTIGGIYGTIVAIKDDTFTVAVGQDNVKLVFARWAIRNVEEVSVENDSEVLA